MRPRSSTIEAMSMEEFLEKCQESLDSRNPREIANSAPLGTRRSSKKKIVMKRSHHQLSFLGTIPEEDDASETEDEGQVDLVDSFNEVQYNLGITKKNLKKVSSPRELARFLKRASYS